MVSSLALAFHNQRVAVLAWAASLGLFGLMYGTLLGEVEGFVDTLGETLTDVLGPAASENLIEAFLSLLAVLMSMFASVFAAIAILRARSEETSGLAESVLATPTSRARYLAGHTTVAIVGGALVLVAGTLGIGLTGSASLGDAAVLGQILGAATVQLVPLILIVSVAVALFGLVPKLTALVWVPVGYGMIASMIGGLIGLPQWALDISPWAIIPTPPAESFEQWPVLGLLVVSVLLVAGGFWGFRHRDLQTVA